jgi:filamentous hemagglutinin
MMPICLSAQTTTVSASGQFANVLLLAGETYRQAGSDVLTPQGDIAIAAQRVDILEARETGRTTLEQKNKQSGLTVAISNPVVTAVQTTQQMAGAARDTKDGRMQALAAASIGLAGYEAHSAVTKAPDKMGGIGINVSLGSSQSQSRSTQTSDSARGSTLAAGRDITLVAAGAGQDSDLTLQGAQVRAGRKLLLAAADELKLLAAQNTVSLQSDNQSRSASIGVGLNTSSGFSVTASASKGKGNASGDDLTHATTKVGAGDTAQLIAGGDASLQGATVQAPRIVADIGTSGSGDLLIERSATAR